MNAKLWWRRRRDAYGWNKRNGLASADALAAVSVGLLLLLPAASAAKYTVSTYRQAQFLTGAASVGRTEMERIQQQEQVGEWQHAASHNGHTYSVRTTAEELREYRKYTVEVILPDGTVLLFRRLAAQARP
ncbi:hypothetical protein [uncultured Megasphaera sp.]|uniref:hypothetical protein n=1 Tax=uncultured Megasphaera sp. TaxID=165188 RepID=UPI002658B848|nr:hypothetical protein [uncultured Megasphaera sp.]